MPENICDTPAVNNIKSEEELPYNRDSSEILKKTRKRYQDLVLWAWLEILFTPIWYQF